MPEVFALVDASALKATLSSLALQPGRAQEAQKLLEARADLSPEPHVSVLRKTSRLRV